MDTLESMLAPLRGRDGGAAVDIVADLARGAVALSDLIATAGKIGGIEEATQRGGGGDVQAGLDVVADQIFLEAVSRAPVAVYGSEEMEHPMVLDRSAPYALAIDPLDGSSNIHTNMAIGTIFSILPVAGDVDAAPGESFLQAGRSQVAAGFFVYGPQLTLILTLGEGTHVFVHSPNAGGFVRTHAGITVPGTSAEFAINMSNYRHWDDAVRHYIDDCLSGAEGPHGRDFNMRWLGSMVADAYRILVRGGVYLYPSDHRKGYTKGRLRLVYEANPLAMVMEQAGGLATNGRAPILDLVPGGLHERVPLVFGSHGEVSEIQRYHDDVAPAGVRSPLFGSRGLFRP